MQLNGCWFFVDTIYYRLGFIGPISYRKFLLLAFDKIRWTRSYDCVDNSGIVIEAIHQLDRSVTGEQHFYFIKQLKDESSRISQDWRYQRR